VTSAKPASPKPPSRKAASPTSGPKQPANEAAPRNGASAPTPDLRPAVAVVNELLRDRGMRLDPAASELVALAGHLAGGRQPSGVELPTEALLFAAVESGRAEGASERYGSAPQRLAEAITRGREKEYSGVLARFARRDVLSESVDFERPTIIGLTPNITDVFQDAGELPRSAETRQIGTAAIVLALLRNAKGLYANHLATLGLSREELLEKLSPELERLVEAPVAPVSPSTPEWLSGYRTDSPLASRTDFLDISREVQSFAYLAASRQIDPPLSIGLFGKWGSGKTFFMERMYQRIEEIADPTERYQKTGKFHGGIVQIRFNAWHYIETNLWASLVEFIFHELDRWLSREGKERKQIDALFEALETSKQLRLDAVRDLLASRRNQKDAEAELTRARQEHDEALRQRAVATPGEIWAAAAETFLHEKAGGGRTVRQHVEAAAEALGVGHLRSSGADLARLVDDTRAQGARTRALAQSLIARLRSPWVAVAVIGGVLAIPLLVEGLRQVVAHFADHPWLARMNGGVLALASFLGSAAVAGRWLLDQGHRALDRLDGFRGKLDTKVAEKTGEERRRVEAAEKMVSEAQQAVSAAQQRLTAAADLAAAAELEYASDNARGRLNRFGGGRKLCQAPRHRGDDPQGFRAARRDHARAHRPRRRAAKGGRPRESAQAR
jgi:hypothetical protein